MKTYQDKFSSISSLLWISIFEELPEDASTDGNGEWGMGNGALGIGR
ncbi:hypothetical protein [Nostoc sp. UHCC 0252]|nr:hypothetical protein [Nostoc sp. UHCC 0252]MEA5601457.1 hypothetical protein [Nostoc sp. UHCC 0252]